MTLLALSFLACSTEPPDDLDVYSQAHGCYALRSGGKYLVSSDDQVAFSTRSVDEATAFRFQPADLGSYLLYDPERGFVVNENQTDLQRLTELESDVTLVDDGYISGAQWSLTAHAKHGDRLALKSDRTGLWLDEKGVVEEGTKAADLELEPVDGCAEFPELSVDAEGEIGMTVWEDGELYGYVDVHSHLLTNFGFAGGMYHGAPFHPLGVEHALHDCAVVHGEMGRKDMFGWVYDNQGNGGDLTEALPMMLAGEIEEDNHYTDGYPTFTDWPHANERFTHQTQYYKWLERSYLSGLRLVVQHATTNSVICHLTVGEEWSPARYSCEDMVGVDREIEGAYDMERYIDAQSGGPGKGWFRIVRTPEEARQVIEEGKMAVILGIETSDLFDCHLTPREGGPVCDEAYVDAQLDHYYDLGVRALFPNHKYDNAFTPGDGSDGFIEVGNFLNSGHYTNKVQNCPEGVPGNFDGGSVSFSGLLEPRDEYQSDPPEDVSGVYGDEPLDAILPYALKLTGGGVDGQHCQNGTLTPIGEYLINGMMQRGMIIEVDHLPMWSYVRAVEMLEANDYPAVGTHGRDWDGKIFALGGTTFGNFSRCHDAQNPGAAMNGYNERLQRKIDAGGHASLGFGFDYNGLASGPRNRFGDDSPCVDQTDPVTYPFTSYDGAITFTEPLAGERVFDYGTEGMAHIGLIPEYIQDARNDGATDADLEPLFRSAEGYVQVWEKAVARAEAGAGQ